MTQTAKPTPNQKLRYERERRGWSQQDVADKVGTTQLNVGRWERGITVPGPYFRQKLCSIYEKTVYELGLVAEEKAPDTMVEIAPVAIPSQTVSPALWNVPYNRNLFFTGREAILAHLHEALTSEEQPIALTQPYAISGLGGIGKTQTAVEYAYRYRHSYDTVLWARADSADLLISDFLLIAALLNLPQHNQQDQSLVVKAVLNWLDTHARWLLILDNADHLEMLSAFIPSAGKGHVLLTTRAHSTGTIAQRIELEKMEQDEGILLLLRRSKYLKGDSSLDTVSTIVRTQAQAIVEAIDGLPLALDQAGAYIEETGCSLADYLKFYTTRHARLLRTRGQDASGHPEPVATTWALSFEKVALANRAAAELLRLCAFLHPDEIPEKMIVEGVSELGSVLQSAVEDEMEMNEAIGELRKYSLVKRDAETKTLNMHRLVQVVLKDTMSEDTQRAWAERTVRMVNKAFSMPNSLVAEVAMWPMYQSYLPHAQTCADMIKQWHMTFVEAASLLHKAGIYLSERGRYDEAIQLIQPAFAIRKQTLGDFHLEVAESLNALAEVYDTQGQYAEAEPLYQQALTIREEILGPMHPAVAHCLGNLAWLYREVGKYVQAEAYSQRAVMICEAVLVPTHPELATSLNSLGAIYYSQGKYKEAEPVFQRTFAIREQILSEDSPEFASSLNNLATIYRFLEKYTEAEHLLLRALAINERLGNAPDIAYNLNNLAGIYSAQARYEEAEPLLRRALTLRQQALSPQHPATATSLNGLGKLYTYLRRYEEAELLFQQALIMREQVLGTSHPDVATSMEDYAALLRKTNREPEAIAMEAHAQIIREANTSAKEE